MILVELFSKEDCHLCDVAMEVIIRLQKTYPFNLNVIKIREGDEHHQQMKDRIPVVYINKEFAFQCRIPEEEFVRKLRNASPTAQQ